MNAIRKMALALVLGTAALAPASADAGHSHRPRCYWKTVVRYRYETQPFYVTVRKYRPCGTPYFVKVKQWRTVKVPYHTRIKVCY